MIKRGWLQLYRLEASMMALQSRNFHRVNRLTICWRLLKEEILLLQDLEVNQKGQVQFSCTLRMRRATLTLSNTKTNLHTTNKKRQLCVLRLIKSWAKCLLGKIEIVIHSFPLSILILVEVITTQPLKRALCRSNLSLEVIPPSSCQILHEDTISIFYIL